jgi:Flp pilus assembly protein CpaB
LISPEELMREGELGKIVEPGYVAMAFPIDELSSVSYGIQPGDHVDILMSFFFIEVDQETQTEAPLCPPLCPAPEGAQENIEAPSQIPRPVAQLTVQDAEVLGVGRWGYTAAVTEQQAQTQEQQQKSNNEVPAQQTVILPEYITLMLSPQDALVLKLARELGASIDMAVRAQDDHQVFTTQQVTLDYILARFAITLPAKQPYAVQKIQDLRPAAPK